MKLLAFIFEQPSYSLNNAIIIVLPSRNSYVTKPLDVRIVCLFKAMLNKECKTYTKTLHTLLKITKFQVDELTAKPYMKVQKSGNLTSTFKKTDIQPYNTTVISDSRVIPVVTCIFQRIVIRIGPVGSNQQELHIMIPTQ